VSSYEYDAVVVGSGPNGMSAAITLAQAGCSVLVLEAKPTPGGGVRSAELTLPGFVHDVGSAVHPYGVGSPFFRGLPLGDFGLKWVSPDAPLAHPLDNGAVMLEMSLDVTSNTLGRDGDTYRALMAPLVENWRILSDSILRPLLCVPTHPLLLARFGYRALPPATLLARTLFQDEPARALFGGLAAHATLPLDSPATSAAALVLGMLGHAVNWPFPKGGAQSLTDALTAYFRFLGGEIYVDHHVCKLVELPPARAVLLDVTPKQFLNMAGDRLPTGYQGWLKRYRYGPGVFKVDYALDGPVPWKDPNCLRAGTVHLGGTLREVAASERALGTPHPAEHPYVLAAQHSLFDATRAPAGKHTLWAYCHVPNGSTVDMTERIEAQLERFAPGFKDLVLARSTMNTADLERYSPNYVGGDIGGGAATLWQLVVRPVPSPTPYRTPLEGVYLCSSSTPPGGGVHGMCGYWAARTVLQHLRLLSN
jgi:phytoene dehydrogenase-like protein